MSKVEIYCNYKPSYYDPHEIICLQTAGKHNTAYFIINPNHPKGYEVKLPCKHLGEHEEKLKDYPFFMRVCSNSVVNLNHVRGLGKENVIEFKLPFFKEEIYLDTDLYKQFREKMKLVSAMLFQLSYGLQDAIVLVA